MSPLSSEEGVSTANSISVISCAVIVGAVFHVVVKGGSEASMCHTVKEPGDWCTCVNVALFGVTCIESGGGSNDEPEVSSVG